MNLEENISEWRLQMLSAGIKTPAPLEELESHLREDITRQMQSGLSAQQAFESAAKRIGHALELKREFKKIGAPMEIQKVIKLAGIICVATALAGQLLTCAPVVFAFAFALGSRLSLMAKVLPLTGWAITVAITVLSWKYNHKLLPVIRNQPLRRAVGIVCYAGCLLWIRFVLFHLPIGEIRNFFQFYIFQFFLTQFLFGAEWAVIAILGGIAHGLEKAAGSQNAAVDS